MSEKMKRGAVIAQAAAGIYALWIELGYPPLAAQRQHEQAEMVASKALDLIGYTDEDAPPLRNRERPQTQDEAPAPRFVKLTTRGGSLAYVNAARIDTILSRDPASGETRSDIFTTLESGPLQVRETVEEILEQMGAVQP